MIYNWYPIICIYNIQY